MDAEETEYWADAMPDELKYPNQKKGEKMSLLAKSNGDYEQALRGPQQAVCVFVAGVFVCFFTPTVYGYSQSLLCMGLWLSFTRS